MHEQVGNFSGAELNMGVRLSSEKQYADTKLISSPAYIPIGAH